MRRRTKVAIVLASIAVLLIGVRLALPYIVKDVVNDRLRTMKAYEGHVDDVHLALWRGAYGLEGIRLDKRGVDNSTSFFRGDRMDFSVEWRSLLRGRFVAEAAFSKPEFNLVQARTEAQSELGKEVDWRAQLEQLFPIEFNTIEIHDGTVTFRAPGIRTEDSLKATHIQGWVSNLTNVVAKNKDTFAEFQADAVVLGDGAARAAGSVNPFARQPMFDVNVAVENVQLPRVNPWLRQYIKADAEGGAFELFIELAAADGRFKGYAKPVMRDVNIYGEHDKGDNPLRKLWEGVVEFAANVFENQAEDQVAARVPFSGTVQNPKASLSETMVSVVRNAFVAAFARSLEGSISIRDVKKNLSKYEQREEKKERKKDSKEPENKKEPPKTVGPRAA